MQPLNFAAIIGRCKQTIHYTLSAATIMFGVGTLACIAITPFTTSQAPPQAAVICALGLTLTIALGHKLQQKGILNDPSAY